MTNENEPVDVNVRLKLNLPVARLLAALKALLTGVSTKLLTASPALLPLLLQLLCLGSVLYAVSWYSIPGALALGGVVGLLAVQSHPDNSQAKADAELAAKTRTFVATLKAGQKLGHGDSVSVKAVADHLSED